MSGPEDMGRIPRQKPGFELRMVAEHILLYHALGQTLVQVNQTAALIWGLCDGQRDLAGIAALLARAYPEAASSLEPEVGRAARRLLELGCLEMR